MFFHLGKKHHLDVVKFLVGRGAPLNPLDNEDKTPLDLIGPDCAEITEYMRGIGAKTGSEIEKLTPVIKVDYE